MDNSTKHLNIVAYTRVSTARQALGDSTVAQEEAIRAWADENGHRIVEVYTDDAKSGTLEASGRLGLLAVLALIKSGEADAVVVHRIDRLARELHVQEAVLSQVWDSGASVWEAVDGQEVPRNDPKNPYRQLLREVMGAVAAFERNMIVARMQGGRERKRANGGYTGGYATYGFDLVDGELVPQDGEQQVLAYLREQRPDHSFRALADDLNERGIPAKFGGLWRGNTVRAVLMRDAERRELQAAA